MNMLTSDNLEDLKKDAETAENPTLKRLMKAWESKQARTARKAGGLGMVAVSLAACGSDSDSDSDDGGEGETPEEILGNIFMLTADADTPENLEPTGESSIEGDIFNAPTIRFDAGVLNNVRSPSLQGDDILIGNEGVQDILNAELNSTFGVLTGNAPTITDVEVLNLQVIDSPAVPAGLLTSGFSDLDGLLPSGAVTPSSAIVSGPSFVAVDFKNVSGAEQIWMDTPDADSELVVYNVQAPAAIGIRNADNAGYVVGYADDALGSDTAEQAIVIDNAMGAALDVAAGGADDITTMSVAASGDNDLTVYGELVDVEVINVAGGSTLELIDGANGPYDNFSSLIELNAGGYAGDLTMNIDGSLVLETVETGSGDDEITMTGAHFSSSVGTLQTADFGGGDNTLILVDNADVGPFVSTPGIRVWAGEEIEALDFTIANVSGVTTLQIDEWLVFDWSAGGTFARDQDVITLDLDGLNGLSTVRFDTGIDVGDSGDNAEFFFDNAPDALTLEMGQIRGDNQIDLFLDNTTDLVVNVDGDVEGELEIDGDEEVGYNQNLETIAINISGDVQDEVDIRDQTSLSSLEINVEGYADEIEVADNVALTDLSISVGGDADNIDLDDLEALTTLTLDVGGVGDVDIDNTPSLTTINLSGGAETAFDIDASGADFGSAVTINIGTIGVDNVGGDEALDYTNESDSVREIFKFTGDDFGDIDISAFEAGSGSNRDQIDFSEFAGVNDTDDLVITDQGSGEFTIEAADAQFEGTISLQLTNSDASDLDSSLMF